MERALREFDLEIEYNDIKMKQQIQYSIKKK